MDRNWAVRQDDDDALASLRHAFALPDDQIYLDGNSLGALPAATAGKVAAVIQKQWGSDLIGSWNTHDWINLPQRVGDRIAALIGADAGEVVTADSTSVNLFKLLTAALPLRADRRIILSDTGNFPSDLYVAGGLVALLAQGYELRTVAPEEVEANLDSAVAVLMLTEVDYRTGRRHDMRALTAAAHAIGAVTIWDLCHSAGALEVALNAAQADFAVGCGYKYLNGGPGAPAFMFVAHRHQAGIRPVLSGWMGHEKPFDFDLTYRPAEGIARNLAGTPSVIGLTALEASLDVFESTSMQALQAKSYALSDFFIELADQRLLKHGLEVVTPRSRAVRGSQVSLRHDSGYAIMQAVIADGVVGDFRAPDILRFGLTPLYTRFEDVWLAVEAIERVMTTGSWRRERYAHRALVT